MLIFELFFILLSISLNIFIVSYSYAGFFSFLGVTDNKLFFMFVLLICILAFSLLIALFDKDNLFIGKWAEININLDFDFILRMIAVPLTLLKLFSFMIGTVIIALTFIIKIIFAFIRMLITDRNLHSFFRFLTYSHNANRVYKRSDSIATKIIKLLIIAEHKLIYCVSRYRKKEA